MNLQCTENRVFNESISKATGNGFVAPLRAGNIAVGSATVSRDVEVGGEGILDAKPVKSNNSQSGYGDLVGTTAAEILHTTTLSMFKRDSTGKFVVHPCTKCEQYLAPWPGAKCERCFRAMRPTLNSKKGLQHDEDKSKIKLCRGCGKELHTGFNCLGRPSRAAKDAADKATETRGKKTANLIAESLSNSRDEALGKSDADKEKAQESLEEISVKEFVAPIQTPPPTKDMRADDLPARIFICRGPVKASFWTCYYLALFTALFALLSYMCGLVFLVWPLYLLLCLFLYMLVPLGTMEVWAETKYLSDERDDRPFSDRSRDVVLGKIYSLEYYCTMRSNSIVLSMFGIQPRVPWNLIYYVYPDFYRSCNELEILGDRCRIGPLDVISSSLWGELISRKTDCTLTPQLEMIRKNIDYISGNKHLLLAAGLSVTTTTIKIARLQLSSTTDKPFCTKPPAGTSNMAIEFTTSGLKQDTALLKTVIKSLISGIQLMVNVLLLLGALILCALAMFYLAPILKTLLMSFLDVPSVSHFNPLLHLEVCEGGCVGLLYSFYESCMEKVSFNPSTQPPHSTWKDGWEEQIMETIEKIKYEVPFMDNKATESVIYRVLSSLILVMLLSLGTFCLNVLKWLMVTLTPYLILLAAPIVDMFVMLVVIMILT